MGLTKKQSKRLDEILEKMSMEELSRLDTALGTKMKEREREIQ